MAETSSRFASLDGSVESFIAEQENQNTVKKKKRDVALLTAFLRTKGERFASLNGPIESCIAEKENQNTVKKNKTRRSFVDSVSSKQKEKNEARSPKFLLLSLMTVK